MDWTYPAQPAPPAVEPPFFPIPPRRVPKGQMSGTSNYPREGCFIITAGSMTGAVDASGRRQAATGSTYEGMDPDGLASYRVTGRTLRMTVKLRSNNPKDFFSARIPAGSPMAGGSTTFFNQPRDAVFQDSSGTYTYNSQWAEVYYQLVQNGGFAGTTPLYSLYRGQAVMVANNSQINGAVSKIPYAAATTTYTEFSCQQDPNNPGMMYFNTPVDMANNGGSDFSSSSRYGSLLLDDVISFEITPWTREAPQYWGDLMAPNQGCNYSSRAPGILLSNYTTQDASIKQWVAPMDGVRITFRVWDAKQMQARQITIYQDM